MKVMLIRSVGIITAAVVGTAVFANIERSQNAQEARKVAEANQTVQLISTAEIRAKDAEKAAQATTAQLKATCDWAKITAIQSVRPKVTPPPACIQAPKPQ